VESEQVTVFLNKQMGEFVMREIEDCSDVY